MSTEDPKSKKLNVIGWLLATVGAIVMPPLGILGLIIGIVFMIRHEGEHLENGLGLVCVSVLVTSVSVYVWLNFLLPIILF